jgi:vacuolar-type H+-ATPase subunit I/STV1
MLRDQQNYFRFLEAQLGVPVHLTELKLQLEYHESADAGIAKDKLLLSYNKRCAEIQQQLEEIQKQLIDLREEYRAALKAIKSQ